MNSTNEILTFDEFDNSLYEMANLRPKRTMLPYVINILYGGTHQHGPRLKVSTKNRYIESETFSITIPGKEIIDSNNLVKKLKGSSVNKLFDFIDLNVEVLTNYWYQKNGILDTEDLLDNLNLRDPKTKIVRNYREIQNAKK